MHEPQKIKPAVRLGLKNEIKLPQEIIKKLKLKVGDFFELQTFTDGIMMAPKKLIPNEQEWFWTKDWQSKEIDADKAIKENDLIGPFNNAEDSIHALKTAKI